MYNTTPSYKTGNDITNEKQKAECHTSTTEPGAASNTASIAAAITVIILIIVILLVLVIMFLIIVYRRHKAKAQNVNLAIEVKAYPNSTPCHGSGEDQEPTDTSEYDDIVVYHQSSRGLTNLGM